MDRMSMLMLLTLTYRILRMSVKRGRRLDGNQGFLSKVSRKWQS